MTQVVPASLRNVRKMTFHIILAEMLIEILPKMLLGYPDHAWVPQKRAKNDFSDNFSGNAPRMA
ncbi:hypothetical protein T11_17410 [Trichinella zimbabwensis]|uniref:Uncharacterized protein n=2 Tax=Trichinella zimbabwensis TaxID=268475 RepID=A0A0V1GG23_9BILA|nr:hypothetical protein T11_17410 [Trichinella zimbabwensis]